MPLIAQALAAPAGAPPARLWFDSFPWLLPSPAASRWLLLADLTMIVTLAVRSRRPFIVMPVGFAGGFLALIGLGMLLTDFYLGILGFHILAGTVGVLALGPLRWMGGGLLALTLLLGIVT